MNRKIYAAKNDLKAQKRLYLFLITVILLGIISGIVYTFFLDKDSKIKVLESIETYFYLIKNSTSINYIKSLSSSCFINIAYLLLIWLLGISLIGFPIIVIILFFKSFIIGFSVSSIIMKYGLKGLFGSFLYVFPHQIVMLIIYLLVSFYSINFCYKLFKYLFFKKTINFKYSMDKYVKILIISSIISIITTLYEVFISTYLMKLFTLTLK